MTTPTDKELIALLHSPRPQDKANFERYLDSLSIAMGNDTLHRLASQVVTYGIRPHHVGWFLCPLLIVAWILMMADEIREGKSILSIVGGSVMPLSLTFSAAHSLFTQPKVKGPNNALLLLATRNDSRALPLLISEWRMHPSQKLRDWNERVEAEATRLLDENQGSTTSVEWRTMRNVVEKVMEPFQTALLRNRKDITPGQAYFVAAILRILSRAGGLENKVLLKKVAALPTDARKLPNRTLVTEVAAVYQDGAVTSVPPPTTIITATTPTATPVQTLHRS